MDEVSDIFYPYFDNNRGQMYLVDGEMKDMTENTTSASYLVLLLPIERDIQLFNTSVSDKCDHLNVDITNFSFLIGKYSNSACL